MNLAAASQTRPAPVRPMLEWLHLQLRLAVAVRRAPSATVASRRPVPRPSTKKISHNESVLECALQLPASAATKIITKLPRDEATTISTLHLRYTRLSDALYTTRMGNWTNIAAGGNIKLYPYSLELRLCKTQQTTRSQSFVGAMQDYTCHTHSCTITSSLDTILLVSLY